MHDIAEFLGGRDPFSGLDEEALEELATRTEVEFFPAGTTIIPQGKLSQGRIRVIRRGAVELVDHGTPVDLLGEGEMLGHPSVLSGLPARREARAKEDTLVYSLAADDVIPAARPAVGPQVPDPLAACPDATRRRGRARAAERRGGPADRPCAGWQTAGDRRRGPEPAGDGAVDEHE